MIFIFITLSLSQVIEDVKDERKEDAPDGMTSLFQTHSLPAPSTPTPTTPKC